MAGDHFAPASSRTGKDHDLKWPFEDSPARDIEESRLRIVASFLAVALEYGILYQKKDPNPDLSEIFPVIFVFSPARTH